MEPETPAIPPAQPATPVTQRVARIALAMIVVAMALWVMFDFLPALAWAAVLAIALWPLYRRLLAVLPGQGDRVWGPVIATLVVGVVFIAPIVMLGVALAKEARVIVELISQARHTGLPVPALVAELPLVGSSIAGWWQANLSDPATTEVLIGRLDMHSLSSNVRLYGGEVVHRLALFGFTLLTLFFLFRDGNALIEQVRRISDRLIGVHGERVGRQIIGAVHGTVNGLVLVGLAEGVLLGITYAAVGLPHSTTVGAVTGVAAVIPFAAPIVYGLAAAYLFAIGQTAGALIIVAVGSIVVFCADHFVRPFLIGGSTRLPFLMVLFSILGGLESMGFIGLFLGPATMAAFMALWREWTEPGTETLTTRAAPAPPGAARRRQRPRRV